MNQIYFTADLHFGHTNILKHSPKRPFADVVDIRAHDEWLLDKWRATVDKRDTVYVLGDLTFLKSEDARHLLEKLPGQKFLIEGNHDGSIMLHGHCHGKLDEHNAQSMDLRFDVGIDGTLANLEFLNLEDIYNAATEKIIQYKCNNFAEYARNNYRSAVM